jgi:hypothetical protein
MVPFSFLQTLLKSRVMKERLLPSSPLTGAKRATLLNPYLVGQTCRFAPIKKLPCLPILPSNNFSEPNGRDGVSPSSIPMWPWKNRHEPNPFPKTQPAPGVLHFLSVPIAVSIRGLKMVGSMESIIERHTGQAQLKGFKEI